MMWRRLGEHAQLRGVAPLNGMLSFQRTVVAVHVAAGRRDQLSARVTASGTDDSKVQHCHDDDSNDSNKPLASHHDASGRQAQHEGSN